MKSTSPLLTTLIVAGREMVGDCSPAVIRGIDAEALARTLGDVSRCYSAGLIDRQEALLFARVHWGVAAIKAIHTREGRS